MSFRLRNKSGLTLIEVMISIGILAFISLGITQALNNSMKLRKIINEDGEFYNSIRLAVTVLETDLSMVYDPKIMIPPKDPKKPANPADAQDLAAIIAGDQRKDTEFWGDIIDKTGIRPSHFIGKKDSLSFISASHYRVYRKSPESIFGKVSYKLEKDEFDKSDDAGEVLVKTLDTDAFRVDKDDTDHLRHYPLLRGIKKMEFRYYLKSKDRWEKEWDTEDPDTKGIFPDLVEMTLEVKGDDRLKFEGRYKMKVEIPLDGLHPSI